MRYSRAGDYFEWAFRMDGYEGGGPLWEANRFGPDRACFYVWKSAAGIWHAFKELPHGSLRHFEHVAEGATRSIAFDAALNA